MAQEIRKLLFGDHDPYVDVETFSYNEFAWQTESEKGIFMEVIKEVKPKLIIEIGTWIGGSAILMAKASQELNLDCEIICIDTWLGSVEHWGEVCNLKFRNGRPILYDEFLSNVLGSKTQDIITPFPIDSTNGLLFLKKHNIKAQLIYVDAGHDYQSVKNDLYNASNVISPSYWILGDDYHHPDVRRAAIEVFGEPFLHAKGNKYIWVK